MMNIANLTFKEFIDAIIRNMIQPVIVLIFALAILYFLWNVTQFIRKSDDPKEIEKFKINAMWGIVAIFVMASMWGLVEILINSFVPGAGIPSFGSSNPNQYSEPIGHTKPEGYTNFKVDLTQTNLFNGKIWVDKYGNPTGNIGDGISPMKRPLEGGPNPTSP